MGDVSDTARRILDVVGELPPRYRVAVLIYVEEVLDDGGILPAPAEVIRRITEIADELPDVH